MELTSLEKEHKEKEIDNTQLFVLFYTTESLYKVNALCAKEKSLIGTEHSIIKIRKEERENRDCLVGLSPYQMLPESLLMVRGRERVETVALEEVKGA